MKAISKKTRVNSNFVCVCEGNMVTSQRSVHTPSEIVLTAACVLKIHTSIIIVSITRLCSPFGHGLEELQ